MTPRCLLIMRHGKSDWTSEAKSDFDRPLATRGRKAVKRMCGWMIGEGIRPDLVISSPANRARQTALRVCKELGIDGTNILWDPSIYEAELGALFRVLSECRGEDQSVMLIGHNPSLEALVRYLSGAEVGAIEATKFFPTAAVARFDMPDDWTQLYPGSGRNMSITRPRDLQSP